VRWSGAVAESDGERKRRHVDRKDLSHKSLRSEVWESKCAVSVSGKRAKDQPDRSAGLLMIPIVLAAGDFQPGHADGRRKCW
jgi:hypothetical protein